MGRRKHSDGDGGLLDALYEFDEHEVAEAVGLRRQVIRDARDGMARGKGWEIVKGAVLYTEDGLMEMLCRIPLLLGAVQLDETMKRSRVNEEWHRKMEGCRRARVTGMAPNVRVVRAVLDTSERVDVVVGDQSLFSAGMEMPVRMGAEGQWELGCRRPRERGRW